jgi:hypothetical protein
VADLAQRTDCARGAGASNHRRRGALRNSSGGDPGNGAAPSRETRPHRSHVGWPSLAPPQIEDKSNNRPLNVDSAIAAAARKKRLFVTIEGLNGVLPPLERLRTIYPRYLEAQASAGPDGLAFLPFRSGTPYEGEDLVYLGSNPEQFFARCTRQDRPVPGTCTNERALDGAEITMRFPRDWLTDWRNVAVGFDRLVEQLHPDKK